MNQVTLAVPSNVDDIVSQLVEIELVEQENFLKVRETLTRIGVASRHENTLYQSCHILHKRGRCYIVHFKEMFMLDQKPTNFEEADIARRNKIISLLVEWKLLTVVDPSKISGPVSTISQVKIVPFKEKSEWNLVPKYTMGKKRVQSK